MKKSIFLYLIIANAAFSQELIIAEKEQLGKIEVGNKGLQIQYESTEEGFFSPGGPLVDDKADLWFSPYGYTSFLVFSEKEFKTRKYPEYYPEHSGPNGYPVVSQNGVFGYFSGDLFSDMWAWIKTNKIENRELQYNQTYDHPNGFIIELYISGKLKKYVSIERTTNRYSMFVDTGSTTKFRNPEETRAWLPTQPGGFSIGDDGLLYRNGMLWSAIKKPEMAGKYIAKLMSGHNIFVSGERFFRITNSLGELEVELEMPWATNSDKGIFRPYNYGIGPWGEIYCLIPPEPKFEMRKESSFPYWDGGQSELVVVRNHLKYFGRLNDGGVRLRKEATTSSAIVGTYPNKTGFRILEKTEKEETIGGQTAPWYKVRLLDGTEGWFFGAFVHNLYDGPNGNPPPWPNVADW